MAQGWSVGAVCYRSQDAAASVLCASMHGVTASGALTCDAVTLQGSDALLTFTQSSDQGSVAYTHAVPLQQCDSVGFVDLGPILGALVVALAVIKAWRLLISVFDHKEA